MAATTRPLSALEVEMKRRSSVIPLLVVALVAELGCASSDPSAPEATEALPVSVQTRQLRQGETIPAITASASAGGIDIHVTRLALCATIVDAAVNRGIGTIDVVSQISSAIDALCAPTPGVTLVVDYSGTVNSVSAGSYRIRVFEGEGDKTPQYVGSTAVRVQ
jgi:hypothetical protein